MAQMRHFDAQPSRIKTRAFLFGGRAALAVRNKKGVSGAQQNMPYASKPLYGATRIRLNAEVGARSAAPTTF